MELAIEFVTVVKALPIVLERWWLGDEALRGARVALSAVAAVRVFVVGFRGDRFSSIPSVLIFRVRPIPELRNATAKSLPTL